MSGSHPFLGVTTCVLSLFLDNLYMVTFSSLFSFFISSCSQHCAFLTSSSSVLSLWFTCLFRATQSHFSLATYQGKYTGPTSSGHISTQYLIILIQLYNFTLPPNSLGVYQEDYEEVYLLLYFYPSFPLRRPCQRTDPWLQGHCTIPSNCLGLIST